MTCSAILYIGLYMDIIVVILVVIESTQAFFSLISKVSNLMTLSLEKLFSPDWKMMYNCEETSPYGDKVNKPRCLFICFFSGGDSRVGDNSTASIITDGLDQLAALFSPHSLDMVSSSRFLSLNFV